ncbi:MAG TPA: DUF5916 domain-containing protein [Gemmatimonadales bacterium]|nr:DUF5916 domain-containing protein [Gemmatimonadales bacterium]
MTVLPLLLGTLAFGPTDTLTPAVYHGRLGALEVATPKLAGRITVDGILDEPVWQDAAVLTGFSQFTPVDGVAAADSTEVYIWYSATAVHIGVRAFATPGDVRATLSQRDRIFNDDNIQFFLSTFNDGRQATFLAVNPLGVQADGAVNESGRSGGCNGFNCATATREGPDLSQDFVWESAGRLTAWGYELELRIPLKSIRFQSATTQDWGINILRVVQQSGQEQTWTPARVGQSSFLGQSGHLVGLEGLTTGHAFDVIPTLTSRIDGGPSRRDRWDYRGGSPEFGASLRWGVTPNLTLNATANPDFSQVESDAGQFSFDPRQALYFAERRPFFLDGIEQFQVPGNLIYTRRIVQPVLATKVTGKVSGTQIGALVAVDDRGASRSGTDHPFHGIVRLARDLGSGSQIGGVVTQQVDGENHNTVVGVDGRLVLGGIHSITFNGALARDHLNTVTTTAPLWGLGYRLNGRGFRARYTINGVHEDFRTRSGFVSRTNFATATVAHSYTWIRPERTIQSFTAEAQLNGVWTYDSLVHGGGIQDRKFALNLNTTLAGGWTVGASWLEEFFGYDPTLYANYGILQPDGAIEPFVGTPRIPNRDAVMSVGSPQFSWGSFNLFTLFGHDENFPEWASGNLVVLNGGLTLRPSDQLRVSVSVNHTEVHRRSDGSRVTLQTVPRARLEYQLSRALQVRVVSQYAITSQDSLRDESRTGLPIVLRGPDGVYRRASAFRQGRVRTDFLLTYLPTPGTVAYFGYGSSYQEFDPLGRRTLERVGDGFFLKLSYLFRMSG